MKEIIKILKNYKFVKKDFFAFIFAWVLMESLYVIFPQFSRKIISIIEMKWSLENLYLWLIYFFIFIFFTLFSSIVWEYFLNKIWFTFFISREKYVNKILFYKNYKDIINIWTWRLITRVSNWVRAETEIFVSMLNIIISAIFRWLLVVIILWFYIPKLIIVVLFFIVLLILSNNYIRKKIEKYNKKEQELLEENWRNMAKIVMENLVIRVFWKVDYELNNSKNILDKIPFYSTIKETINSFYSRILELLLRILEIWVFFIIWTLIIKEWNIKIAYLIMLTWYIWFLWWPLDKAVSNINRINKELVKYKKLQEFIEKPNDIMDWKEKYIYKTWKIEFIDLKFWYSEKNILFKKLNLKFLEWKKNALVGHSWGWKSTIIKVLLRLYDYSSWKILLDWQELKKLKIDSFYKEIWYLPQEPGIFDGTIRENMEYAFSIYNEVKDNQEKIIWAALEKAQISDMVKKLEKGLDTEVWEKWIKLSWGEKQRLAIARIFLKNPKIIILDEPTSALDSISEAKITKALDELIKDRTSIIIAHRLQTVMLSDKIIVLEKWKIESEWTHNELMLKSYIYKTLVDLQNGKVIE